MTANADAPRQSDWVWMPRLSLIVATLLLLSMPWAYMLGEFGPIAVPAGVLLLGVVGFVWAMFLRCVVLAVANIVIGIFGVPAFLAVVLLLGGP